MRAAAIVAATLAFWWQWRQDERFGLHRWKTAALVLVAAMAAGAAGSRLWELFRAEVIGVLWMDPFRLSQSSSWYFAGMITCIFGAALALRVVRAPIWRGLDFLAPGIVAGQGLQRIGCFLAGDGCYGFATTLPWGIAFPDGSAPVNIPVHPTSLYEAALMTLLFVFLWKRRGTCPPGTSFAIFLVVVAAFVFLLQFAYLAPMVAWGLTEAQLFSVLLVPAGVWILLSVLRSKEVSIAD